MEEGTVLRAPLCRGHATTLTLRKPGSHRSGCKQELFHSFLEKSKSTINNVNHILFILQVQHLQFSTETAFFAQPIPIRVTTALRI